MQAAHTDLPLFSIVRPPITRPDGIPHEVCDLFDRLALEVIAAGHKRYSADAILHRIRWSEQIEKRNREFKCNDHWTAPLARWFMERRPAHKGFFETRHRKES